MVFLNELFQTVRLSKWYLHFDTPSDENTTKMVGKDDKGLGVD